MDEVFGNIIEWIVQNISADDVPGDEGNTEALIYNLVHLAKEGKNYHHYDYEPEQDLEIAFLYKLYDREEF
jgi:hypothetical protein